ENDESAASPCRWLAVCYAHMGRLEEARATLTRLRGMTSVVMPDTSNLRNVEHRELFPSGLRLATGEEGGIIAVPPRVDSAPDAVAVKLREAERRQVTALWCELIGAAPGGRGVDLEDLREVVGGFRRCVSEAADRHQGFVYRDLGNDALVL